MEVDDKMFRGTCRRKALHKTDTFRVAAVNKVNLKTLHAERGETPRDFLLIAESLRPRKPEDKPDLPLCRVSDEVRDINPRAKLPR